MKNLYSIITFILLINISCTRVDLKKEFLKKSVHRGIAGQEQFSRDRIDNENTYQLFFRLNSSEECIRISLRCWKIEDSIRKNEVELPCYFIVEKKADLRSFRKVTGIRYVELARNFNREWDVKKSILLCARPGDPFHVLTNTVYRMRFTAFIPGTHYEAAIHSNKGALFSETEEFPNNGVK